MALLDIFKHKKEERKPEVKPEPVKKPAVKKAPKPIVKKAKNDIAAKVLRSPHVTEKASLLAEENKYVFNVSQRSNKIEIKKAVEGLYGVKVVNVNIIKIKRKKKRVGRNFGWKKGYKKAIVEIKKGQKIEVMPR